MVKLIESSRAKARLRQQRNYDKNRREVTYKPQDRVWLRHHPQSKARNLFTTKLAPRWIGSYRVVRRLGPINYVVSHEETGEDPRTVNVVDLKPCYPTAEELDIQQKGKLRQLLMDDSSDKEFLGFP